MNSALQCLSSVAPLTEYFTKGAWRNQVNSMSGRSRELSQEYSKLVTKMWDEETSSYDPSSFHTAVGKFKSQFKNFQQHDSQELLLAVLDTIHDDLRDTGSSIGSHLTKIVPFSVLSLPIPRKERGLTVHFVDCHPEASVVKHQIKVFTDGVVKDVCDVVSQIFNKQSDALVVAGIQAQSEVTPIADKTTPIKGLEAFADIFVYELSNFMVDVPIVVNFKQEKLFGSSSVGWPRIICIAESLTHADLVQDLKPYFTMLVDDADDLEIFLVDDFNKRQKLASTTNLPYYTQIDVEFSNSAIVDRKAGYEVTEDDGTVLTADDNLTLENCIQLYTSPETTEQANTNGKCMACNGNVKLSKQYEVKKLPPYLIFHLKRYRSTVYGVRKIKGHIQYPVQDLDMSQWCVDNRAGAEYDLIAVNNHMGEYGSGHYTAYAKHHKLDKWYEFNDTHVTRLSGSLVTSNAYFLIYKRREK
ncbi:USP4 [Bugula neritina]|uniref:ubiquitinyl hydrolase 1 n=1 Tax=Bugula neritina TaxID=10212 RepID=A0A7J7JKE6_BUGNE|nr:USP4 [Bugula neritina]